MRRLQAKLDQQAEMPRIESRADLAAPAALAPAAAQLPAQPAGEQAERSSAAGEPPGWPQPAAVGATQSLSTADLELVLRRAEQAVGVQRRLEEGMSTGNALHYASKSSRRCARRGSTSKSESDG